MTSSATSGVRVLLRLEGLSVLAICLIAYAKFGGYGWTVFALCFFAPDVSLLGYLAGPRVGAAAYNIGHSYIGALAVLAAGAVLSIPDLVAAGIIWVAHIGFDRALGFGLKYSAGFGFTHLGVIGRHRVEGPTTRSGGRAARATDFTS